MMALLIVTGMAIIVLIEVILCEHKQEIWGSIETKEEQDERGEDN